MWAICRVSLTFASAQFHRDGNAKGVGVGRVGAQTWVLTFLGTCRTLTLLHVDSSSRSPGAVSALQEH